MNVDRTEDRCGGAGNGMRSSGRFSTDGQDDVAKVRDAADIVRIVGEYVRLKPAGREFKGLCPFHDDHNPSMAVVPHKGIFHCFVCGAGGDSIAFVRRYLKMEFREALEFLAEKLGVQLTPRRRESSDRPEVAGTSRQDLLKANAVAAGFYRTLLSHPEHGAAARQVVERRGIRPDIAERFLLGTSPGADRWDGLQQYVRSKGLLEATFVEAGLLKPRESGGSYDAFRNRLMFPIQDAGGRVIAFGARRLDDNDEPKYLNSPETRLFVKKATLYGLNHASKAIQKERTAILTEGYMDTIACHQAGVENAVAALGTSLTREHAAVLRRFCTRVVLLFDGDDAGQRAADRAVEVFFAEPLDVKIATLKAWTDAKDPDELLKREGGRQVFDRAIDQAEDLLTYRFRRLRANLEGEGIAAVSQGIEGEIATLLELGLRDVPPLRQRLIVGHLAAVAGVAPQVIERAINAGGGPRRTTSIPAQSDPRSGDGATEANQRGELPSGPTLTANEHVLGCLLCDAKLWNRMRMEEQDAVSPAAYRSPLVQQLAQLVKDLIEDGREPYLREVLAASEDLGVQDAAVTIASWVDDVTGRGARLIEHFDSCMKTIQMDREREAQKGASSVAELIEMKRRQLSQSGYDRRVLPRPN